MTAPVPRLLITSCASYLGFEVFNKALQYGFDVCAGVGHLDDVEKVQRPEQMIHYNRLRFAPIFDKTDPSAYDSAMKGCDYIMHIAEPLVPSSSGDMADSEVKSIKAIFAAAKNHSIKRIVFTSHVLALRSWEEQKEQHPNNVALRTGTNVDAVPILDGTEVIEIPEAQPGDSFTKRYARAKIAARKAIRDETIAAHATEALKDLEVVVLHLGFVVGPMRYARTKYQAQRCQHMALLGDLYAKDDAKQDVDVRFAPEFIHIRDAAVAHINALIPSQSFGKTTDFLVVADTRPNGLWLTVPEQGLRGHGYFEEARNPWTLFEQGPRSKFDSRPAGQSLFLGAQYRSLEDLGTEIAGWYEALPEQGDSDRLW